MFALILIALKSESLIGLKSIACFASNDDDPYITVKKDESDDDEEENKKIKNTDNIIAVGHVDQDLSILEFHGIFSQLLTSAVLRFRKLIIIMCFLQFIMKRKKACTYITISFCRRILCASNGSILMRTRVEREISLPLVPCCLR